MILCKALGKVRILSPKLFSPAKYMSNATERKICKVYFPCVRFSNEHCNVENFKTSRREREAKCLRIKKLCSEV